MIVASNLTKRYPGGYEAVKDVSFEISGRADGLHHRPFRRRQDDAGQADRLDRAADFRQPGGQWPESVGPAAQCDSLLCAGTFGMVFQDQKLLFDRSALDNVPAALADRRPAAPRGDSPGPGGARQGRPAGPRERRCRSRFPAASSSVWRLPAPWSTGRPCCWLTSRPAISIPTRPAIFLKFLPPSIRSASPSSSQPTTRTGSSVITPTCCASITGGCYERLVCPASGGNGLGFPSPVVQRRSTRCSRCW